jgi:hypothetical protein
MSYRAWFLSSIRAVLAAGHPVTRRRNRRSGFGVEQLERRALLAAFSSSAQTVTLDLNVDAQIVQVASTGSTYTFTLSGGATNTWSGTAGSGLSASGAVLTADATALSNFSLFKITDSAANTTANFSGSGTNAFNDSFEVTLDSLSTAVRFSGNSSFSGSNNLTIVTDSRVELPSSSCLTMANGNLSMDINTQAVPRALNFSGLMVNAATIQTTGNGLTNIVARGGVGAAVTSLNKGVAVINGGKILGGTSGTMNITGYGYTGVDGGVQGQGVFVLNANTVPSISTISSIGANVSVTGYGANSTNSTLSANSGFQMVNAGVVVGGPGTGGGTFCGTITSGGNASVTVTGYGGTLANQAASQNHYAMGVYLNGTNATITSGGAGLVTVLGTGGGANANTACGMGIQLYCGTITSGTNGSVLVNGTGCTTAQSSFNWGLWVLGTGAKIAAGAGTGSTTVIGTGGGCGTAGSNDGICLTSTGTITATGSGNVTVTGYGGTAGTGSTNRGINVSSNGLITSNGGSVLVTGYGGGSGSSVANYGVATTSNGTITAGGLGSVTVIGYGGNNNGTGTDNYGVAIESGGSGQRPGKVTSSGGNVVVTGTGGGGTSATNIGVRVNQGGFIMAGGSGTVNVTGYGGGRSPGATGANNYGVQITTANSTTANTAQFSCITSSGGAVNVTGFGGGGSGTDVRSTSASNHGVYVLEGAKISSGGDADVTVNGTGGGFGNSTSTGATNCGVVVCSTTTITGLGETFSTITSGGNGNVTINGQGGGSGSGINQWGVAVQAGGQVTSGGTGNVSITGVGGYTSGSGAYGVVVQCVTTSNVSSTVTSGGGNVVIHGTGGGNNASTAHGVFVTVGAQIIAPGTASVTVTGRGGNANGTTGQQNYGVTVTSACSTNRARARITSNNGTVSVTGYGGNTNTTLTNACGSNYGVYMAQGGEISAGGTAPVTVIGYGGGLTQGATNDNVGVCMTTLGTANLATQITSSGGAVTVSGYGGGTNSNSASGSNFGLNIAGGAQISTTGSGTSINITGTGGGGGSASTNYGMQILGCSTLSNVTITTNGGPITLNATEGIGSSTRGIVTSSSAVIGNATNPGNITVLTDSAEFSSATGAAINAAGRFSIAPITPGTSVILGCTTDIRGELRLSAAELNTLSAGTIQIGNSSTGNFTVAANVTIPAAANLTLVSNSTSSTGIGSALRTTTTMGAGRTLDVSALPSLNTSIASATNYSQLNVVGDLSIAGKSLNLSGSYTPAAGDVFVVANATNLSGIFTGLANGSTTTFNGRTLLVNYTSTSVTLTEPSPVVTTNPTNSTVAAGSTATFTAAASGIPTPTLQWQVSTNVGSSWTDIAGATNTTYSFTAAAVDNGKLYRAVFTNTYGTATSTSAALTVEFAPSVTTNPSNQTVSPGATVTFTSAATGNPTPTVKWQSSGDGGTNWSDISGETSTSYSFTAASGDNGIRYRAVFSNTIGSAESNAATLTVNSSSSSPTVTTQPTSQTVTAGNTATFTAAASGSPTPTVQWQVSTDGNNWNAVSDGTGGTTGTYTTATLAAGDNGKQYRAIFSNGVGSAATTNTATLTVQFAPSISTQPTNTTINDGQTATFTAAATGSPAPTVQWQVNTGSGWANVADGTGGTTNSYTTVALTSAQTGYQYRALYTNSVTANVATSAATVTVNSSSSSPLVTTNPTSQTVTAGATVTLSAAASGNPAPTVKWQVNSGSGWSDIAGATSPSYSFTSAAGDNGRQYRAVFTNGVGSDATTTAATVLVPALTTFTVSKGQVQRSFLRYLDVGTNSSATASALAASGRVRLLKADLNGNGAAVVSLTGFVSASGSTLAIDFGAAGLGASRNTNLADGYYTLQLDLNGDGTFETSRRFYRMFGDVNGDRQVDDSDVSLVRAGTTSAYSSVMDTNGDGIVNTSDLLYTTRAKGRKLKVELLLD